MPRCSSGYAAVYGLVRCILDEMHEGSHQARHPGVHSLYAVPVWNTGDHCSLPPGSFCSFLVEHSETGEFWDTDTYICILPLFHDNDEHYCGSLTSPTKFRSFPNPKESWYRVTQD